MKREILRNEYIWVSENMPNASNEEKENMVRRRIFKMRMKKSGLIFLISLGGYLLALIPFSKGTLLEYIGAGVGSFGSIIAVMMFAKTLHDPLTDIEAAEFRVKDSLEKTGKASENDLNEYSKKIDEVFGQK